MSSHLKPRKIRPPRACIFCGGGNISGEHIWPKWASDLIPDAPHSRMVQLSVDVRTRGSAGRPRLKQRQGGTKKIQIYAACKTCNNEWMSGLEQSAQGVLTALITGTQYEIDEADRHALVRWITLKIIVAEHSNRENVAIKASDREEFWRSRAIPPGLAIWAFDCGAGRWRSAYSRRGGTIAADRADVTAAQNTMTVAFGLGRLLIFACYFGEPTPILNWEIDTRYGRELTAPSNSRIAWPPEAVSEIQADKLASTLEETFVRLAQVDSGKRVVLT